MPKVSVVVCARNEEHFIEPCLIALRCQTVRPEIIVIDGKSMDGTVKIARTHADKVISDRGMGIAHARNLGWKSAKSRIVAYCDADSRPPLNWVENITKLIGNNVAVQGPIVPYDGSIKTRIDLKIWGDWFMHGSSKMRYPIVCAANVAFKKSMLKRYPFRLNAPTEDFDVGRRMRRSGRIRFFKELAMPISARRYQKSFYRTVARCYFTNMLRVKLGLEPKNAGYFEKSE